MFSGCKYNEKQRIGINNRCKKTFFCEGWACFTRGVVSLSNKKTNDQKLFIFFI
jgi:hypothetical protein